MGDTQLVSFLGIGAPRAGTTYLDVVLRSHPNLYLPASRKEVHYFDSNYDRGAAWYAGFFTEATSTQRCGEVTPSYLDHPDVAERVAASNPEMRSVVVLRDPVKRAFSHYLRLQTQRADHRTFSEALTGDGRVRQASMYGEGLTRWIMHFPREQVLVLNSDSLFDGSCFSELAAFLDIDANGLSAPEGAVNSTGQSYSALGRGMKKVSRFAYRHGVDGVVKAGKRALEVLPIDPRKEAPARSLSPEEYQSARELFVADASLLDGLCGAAPREWWPELWA